MENKVKTYKDDFFEKFPNASIYTAGRPAACRGNLYGGKCSYGDCIDCWNQPYEEDKNNGK